MKDTSEKIPVIDDGKTGIIKGHAKIILTNVQTGKKEIVEHDNTFQSAFLGRYLRSMGIANMSPWQNENFSNNRLWRNLVGGILLFRDAITAPAEYMPAGNLMVGNGAFEVSNSGTPAELGSYNSIESATGGSNTLTFVYDWNTSQGNGTIGCVCLTTEGGGYIGYGNASGEAASTKRAIDFRQDPGSISITGVCKNGFRYGVSALNLSDKKVTINKRVDQMTQASLFYLQGDKQTEYTYTGDILSSSGTIYTKPIDANRMAIISGNGVTLTTGNTGAILCFDASTETVGTISINNTSGETLKLTTGWTGENNAAIIASDTAGNLYFVTTNDHIAKFTSAGAFVEFVGNVNSSYPMFGRITPDIIIAGQTNAQNKQSLYFYDGVAQRITNGQKDNDAVFIDFLDSIDLLCYGQRQELELYHNPMLLSTINNLDSPVTKDSTQTMKIIYTWTEASS